MDRPPQDRQAEVVTALGAVRARIADACTAAGRDPREVTLIAVTKTYPVQDVATLVQLGVYDIGENKDQEARRKVAELAQLRAAATPAEYGAGEQSSDKAVRWHMIGQLQTNKAASVASYAFAVHSVDRPKLVRALGQACEQRADPLQVFVQVSLDDDPGRGGAPATAIDELAEGIAGYRGLRLRGLMAVPPLDADPDVAFARLAQLSERLRGRHPEADALSAGMSGDLEAAIRHGATHVRVGTALLGRRTPDIG